MPIKTKDDDWMVHDDRYNRPLTPEEEEILKQNEDRDKEIVEKAKKKLGFNY